jgi:hypothetical protein
VWSGWPSTPGTVCAARSPERDRRTDPNGLVPVIRVRLPVNIHAPEAAYILVTTAQPEVGAHAASDVECVVAPAQPLNVLLRRKRKIPPPMPWFSRLRAGAPRLWSRESERGQRPKGRLLRHLRLHLVRCWCPRGPRPDTAPRSACSRALPPRLDAREPRASFVRATHATASLARGSSPLPSPWPLLSRPLYFRAAVWARASTPSAGWAGAAPLPSADEHRSGARSRWCAVGERPVDA